MAQETIKTNNGNDGLVFINRPAPKMNNNALDGFGRTLKKLAKRYISKKRRVYLKTIE